VAKSYLPVRKIDTQESLALLQRVDIVWPTNDWVRKTRASLRVNAASSSSPHSVEDTAAFEEEVVAEEEVDVTRYSDGGPLFLSSESFNRIHTDCLARMVQWEPTIQHSALRVPHFKSISRLLHYRPPGVAEGFAWFLLTSACLSHGAQGVERQAGQGEPKVVTYRNFELGVLFRSQRSLPMSTQPSRLYCYQPTHCSCHADGSGSLSRQRLIHLPLPFHCRPLPYVDTLDYNHDDDEDGGDIDNTMSHEDEVLHFNASPYFHEIPPGTAAISNMLLTPYGKAVLAQQTS
jgi:hypothetical protein